MQFSRIQTSPLASMRLFLVELSLILSVQSAVSFKNMDLTASSKLLSTSVSMYPILLEVIEKFYAEKIAYFLPRKIGKTCRSGKWMETPLDVKDQGFGDRNSGYYSHS